MGEGKVCVIGAGPCGLVSSKILHERGIAFDCFEKGNGIGGLWRYQNSNGNSAAYASLHINTSRRMMQFSDFHIPRHFPDFPHHSQILEYLESYVDHFGFREVISLQTNVEQVVPKGDQWEVTLRNAQGETSRRLYGSVWVANGHHWCPSVPSFPGSWAGDVIHSHEYDDPTPYKGKRVLIVGMGNSGCDIACEISRSARATFLSTRRGAHIIPKYLFGKPLDTVWKKWMWRWLPFRLTQMAFSTALWLIRGPLSRFGVPQPKHRALEEHPTISSDLLNLIGHGKIQMKPDVRRLSGQCVHFADGSEEPIDAIVYATGYHIRFPFLDPSIIHPENNEAPLYKLVVHPDHPRLFFIGLIQPWGAIMPLAELQAKWSADLLEGKTSLPDVKEMRADIGYRQKKMRQRYAASARHTIQVDYWAYHDELRRERRRGPGPQLLPLPEQPRRSQAA